MSLNASRARLQALTKQIASDWARTREHWRDTKADEFEARYMDDLLARVTGSMAHFETLEHVLAKIRHDCE
jgi:hypothetical protein